MPKGVFIDITKHGDVNSVIEDSTGVWKILTS